MNLDGTAPMPRATPLRPLIAALHVGFGVLALTPLVVLAVVFGSLSGLVGTVAGSPGYGTVVGALLAAALLLSGLISAVSVTAGLGLWLGKPWADALTLVASALHVLHFPVGTALGLFSAWVVLVKEPRASRAWPALDRG